MHSNRISVEIPDVDYWKKQIKCCPVHTDARDYVHAIAEGDYQRAYLIARATYRKMVQNLAWATGYNAFAIPLAAGVLYKFGILLSPAMGAVYVFIMLYLLPKSASTVL